MRITLLIAILISGLFAYAQSPTKPHPTKKIKDSGEVYYVRKSDLKTKEGLYSKESGENYVEGHFANDQRTGLWTYSIDKYKGQGNYTADKRHGLWEFKQDSKVFARTYYTKGEVDSCFGYYEDGSIQSINIINPGGSGILKSYYQNGKLSSEVPRKNGEFHGLAAYYFDNGQLYRKLTYENGKLVATSSVFAPNGREIESGDLSNGNGTYFAYNFSAEGKFYKSIEMHYKGSLADGPYISYTSDGKIEKRGSFEADKQVGEWVLYRNGIGSDTIFYSGEDNYLTTLTIENNLQVDRMPAFPGGEAGMYKWLGRAIEYPKDLRENEVSGRVLVRFKVHADGVPGDFEIVSSPHKALSEAVINTMHKMPDWVPGFSYGKPIAVQYTIPVEFRLN